jgi:membrane associated rhomboid family serine protease
MTSAGDGETHEPLAVARRRAQADEWALVLEASHLHPRVAGSAEGFVVSVPRAEGGRAAAALAAWQAENQGRGGELVPDPPRDRQAGARALAVAGALVLFFGVTGDRAGGSAWFVRGSADAAKVLSGEAWRVVTALTLHADFGHVLGNAVAGALFLSGVFRRFGAGLGGLLVLAAGAGGNALNAWLRGTDHVVVGASTAVFGALGLLTASALVRGRARGMRGRAAWVPAAAALALLAMIGTEGERVDLWAHALGLGAGLALGLAAAAADLPLSSRPLQLAAGLVAIATLGASWWLAGATG